MNRGCYSVRLCVAIACSRMRRRDVSNVEERRRLEDNGRWRGPRWPCSHELDEEAGWPCAGGFGCFQLVLTGPCRGQWNGSAAIRGGVALAVARPLRFCWAGGARAVVAISRRCKGVMRRRSATRSVFFAQAWTLSHQIDDCMMEHT